MTSHPRSGGLSRRSAFKVATGAMLFSALGRPASAQPAPIKVGFPVPLTGPYGSEAADQVRCAQLAIEDFNRTGGLNGRPAELLVRDDKLNPAEAVSRTLELIEKDKVDMVVGSLSGAVQLAVNDACKARGMIYNALSLSDRINEASDFGPTTYHEGMAPHFSVGALGRYVFANMGKKVAYLIADYEFGYEMRRAFQTIGDQMGAQVVAEVKHPLGAQDFSSLFPRFISAKPDILCVLNFGRDQLNALKQANEFGLKDRMKIVVGALSSTQRIAGGADAYADVVGASNYYWAAEDMYASSKAFNAAYAAKYKGGVPSDYGSYGYGGVRSMLELARKAGAVDPAALSAAVGTGFDFDLYKGPQRIRACDHQSVQSVFILKSKSEAQMKTTHDTFEIVSVAQADEGMLRSCAELGHKS
ncbi:ABC transporter substrate-binding protein [Bradyrhizobium sp. NP1]|uniref:ABC transporter substrate-binding protein n=1 Tax=Bradyrhizobium sp. NP1 TaxID=3049772 RepID=UPI0025A4E64C|nr:ABC transporter substrate-binding protein [Bradyrhizobium sp. NP1]WJR79806.1 ABC transporter substrate-binding protein [Bradyrhizobium sp. NP1]